MRIVSQKRSKQIKIMDRRFRRRGKKYWGKGGEIGMVGGEKGKSGSYRLRSDGPKEISHPLPSVKGEENRAEKVWGEFGMFEGIWVVRFATDLFTQFNKAFEKSRVDGKEGNVNLGTKKVL